VGNEFVEQVPQMTLSENKELGLVSRICG
jgi:hypothetical protein